MALYIAAFLKNLINNIAIIYNLNYDNKIIICRYK